MLEAHGIGPKDFVPQELSLGDALVALRAGKVDAVVQVIGVPADSVRDAISEVPLRVVPLSAEAIGSLVASKAGYFAFTIPKWTYPLQAQDVRAKSVRSRASSSGKAPTSRHAAVPRASRFLRPRRAKGCRFRSTSRRSRRSTR
jgi:TRAP-type uncharacterized transport system substrate-binding protein